MEHNAEPVTNKTYNAEPVINRNRLLEDLALITKAALLKQQLARLTKELMDTEQKIR